MKDKHAVELSEGPYGKCLLFRGEWTEEILQLMVNEQVTDLSLFHAKLKKDGPLLFLEHFPNLRSLFIVDWNLSDARGIEFLQNLERFGMLSYEQPAVDFNLFKRLEVCDLEWSKNMKSVFDCFTLRKLRIDHLSKGSIPKLSNLDNLEEISLFTCPAISLDCLGALPKLKKIRIANFRKLEGNHFLSNLCLLESLHIQASGGFENLEALRGCHNLRSLILEDIGPINSIKPIESLVNLETLVIMGRVSLLDGDVKFLESFPNLRRRVVPGLPEMLP